jgi:hypothetical protein
MCIGHCVSVMTAHNHITLVRQAAAAAGHYVYAYGVTVGRDQGKSREAKSRGVWQMLCSKKPSACILGRTPHPSTLSPQHHRGPSRKM